MAGTGRAIGDAGTKYRRLPAGFGRSSACNNHRRGRNSDCTRFTHSDSHTYPGASAFHTGQRAIFSLWTSRNGRSRTRFDEGQFLAWTPDGSHLIFNHAPAIGYWDSAIWTVNAAGTQVRMLLDTNPGHRDPAVYGYYADVSPDGERIVYSSCEFPKEHIENLDFEQQRTLHDYEIAVIKLEGTEQQQLTANRSLEHYPVWSPDGNRIALIGNPVSQYSGHNGRGTNILYTIATDGSDWQRVSLDVALAPPAWSPDGERIAFLAIDEEKRPNRLILHIVRIDGSGLTEIASVATISRLRWRMLLYLRGRRTGSSLHL